MFEMEDDDQNSALFDQAADAVVDLGNRLAAENPDADPWALADGLIAGAVHYWLYAHQPQDFPDEDDMMSSRERLEELVRQVMESAEESEYLHSPMDNDVGRA
ncbi:hypothetical protein [Wenzhouxiangella marina]|uniref:Uncharacterized protein n=1 Tax=Wenzhouxiangella marina TaxID=1579979 RepID=A0A0K0XTP7_9GAMM|nr:hypothetical protein [Wenzhouxiangella marina]AKS41058.1 hypothetical protein WM2015_677 [Wenzhouxiangella marina]MBB6087936.1 hypothetical protein [Wenzhouxiangella marina]